MKRIVGYITVALLTLVAAAAVFLGGEPAQPALATTGPRLQARYAGFVSRSEEPVRAVAFSPDSRMLASAGVDGIVRLTALATGTTQPRFTHPGGATALVFSPDGHTVATAGYDGVVRLWRLADGSMRSYRISAMPLWTLAFDPTGTRLAAAGEDRLIHIWSTDNPAFRRTLSGHTLNVWDIAFSPDGRSLASGGFDRTMRLWDVDRGRLIHTSTGPREGIVGLDVRHADGLIVTGGDDATLRLWRPDGSAARTTQAGQFVDAVAFSADGKWLASGGRESHGVNALFKQAFGRRPWGDRGVSARLWRVRDGAMIAAFDRQTDDVVAVAISPDQRWFASGSDDGSVALWHLTALP